MKNFTNSKPVAIVGIVTTIVVMAVCVLVALSILMAANRDASLIENHIPITTVATVEQKSLDGQWVANNNGVKLTATVAHDTIKIELTNNDTTISFWDGSFASFASQGDVIASIKRKSDDIVVSSAEEKNFIVGDGTIQFELSFMGVTKTITATHV